MNFVIDTNKLSDLFLGDKQVANSLRSSEIVYVPVIVIGEFSYGAYAGGKSRHNLALLQDFLGQPSCHALSVDQETATQYAQLRLYLRKRGTPIPANDIWIGALCIQYDLPLLTRDGDFKKLPQIRLVSQG